MDVRPWSLQDRLTGLGLVAWRIDQLLVLGWRRGEDGGHRHDDGGGVGPAHLVDHDGRHDYGQDLEVNTGSAV